jgi:hypothetical protein
MGSSAEHGSSIRITSGSHGDGAGDAEPLLLAAGQAGAGLLQAVLDLLPQAGLFRLLDDVVQFLLVVGQP